VGQNGWQRHLQPRLHCSLAALAAFAAPELPVSKPLPSHPAAAAVSGLPALQVRRWTMPKRLASSGQASSCILDVDRIVVPVHQGLHWVCAVIDLQHQKLIYYDSLKVGCCWGMG
jgi:hypothetical protein